MCADVIGSRPNAGSLRPERPELRRLAWVFVFSLLLHLLCWGTYTLAKKAGWWEARRWPVWLQKLKQASVHTPTPLQPPPPRPPPQDEIPLMFVDVNPVAATPEPPKAAVYYSSRNALAANPEPAKETALPKIEGKQQQTVKTQDTPPAPLDKLQPDFNALKKQRETEEARAKPAQLPGDLTMAKPQLQPRPPDPGNAEQPRPRTIKEALQRRHRDQSVGEKMKQEGGVSRRLEISSFDTKATPFGAYDAALIEAVQSRWYDLLDHISYNGYRHGKVVVEFRLSYDGTVSRVSVPEDTVGLSLSLLCQKAVQDPAPFDRWPRDMRLTMDKDYRDIRFTFFYN